MSLRALVPGTTALDAASKPDPSGHCLHCGLPAASARAPSAGPTCPLCALSCQLDRLRIDEEAELIWLPEMSQAALNVLLREMHLCLRALGEEVHAGAQPRQDTPERRRLYHAERALRGRAAAAAMRLGTGKPSDLGHALARLSPGAQARRGTLLGGVRLLSRGRFFEADRDVYPAVVDGWRAASRLGA